MDTKGKRAKDITYLLSPEMKTFFSPVTQRHYFPCGTGAQTVIEKLGKRDLRIQLKANQV